MAGSMHLYVTELRDFYETPLGTVARRLIRRQIRNIWPHANGLIRLPDLATLHSLSY